MNRLEVCKNISRWFEKNPKKKPTKAFVNEYVIIVRCRHTGMAIPQYATDGNKFWCSGGPTMFIDYDKKSEIKKAAAWVDKTVNEINSRPPEIRWTEFGYRECCQ